VITLEPTSRDANPHGEVVQLLIRVVADQVRPQVTVAGPDRRINVDGHQLFCIAARAGPFGVMASRYSYGPDTAVDRRIAGWRR
jgi:hypothetical protein